MSINSITRSVVLITHHDVLTVLVSNLAAIQSDEEVKSLWYCFVPNGSLGIHAAHIVGFRMSVRQSCDVDVDATIGE